MLTRADSSSCLQADGFHSYSLGTGSTLEDSEIAFTGDDFVNLWSGSYTICESIRGSGGSVSSLIIADTHAADGSLAGAGRFSLLSELHAGDELRFFKVLAGRNGGHTESNPLLGSGFVHGQEEVTDPELLQKCRQLEQAMEKPPFSVGFVSPGMYAHAAVYRVDFTEPLAAAIVATDYNLASFPRMSSAGGIIRRGHFHDSCGSGGRMLLQTPSLAVSSNVVERFGGAFIWAGEEIYLGGTLGMHDVSLVNNTIERGHLYVTPGLHNVTCTATTFIVAPGNVTHQPKGCTITNDNTAGISRKLDDLSEVLARSANSTEYWLGRRRAMAATIWSSGELPTRSKPDYILPTNITGASRIIWDISSKFLQLNSTVFYSPRSPGGGARSKTAFLSHHGHSDAPLRGGNWWGFYNVSSFLHAAPFDADVFILSMPLKGANGWSSGTKLQRSYGNQHGFFAPLEKKGDKAIRYFIEPTILTINFAMKELGYESVHMMGLSGGGWTTTLAAALDLRIQLSFPDAGSLPLDVPGNVVVSGFGDFEQWTPRPYVAQCNYTCMYVLAGLEKDRGQLQVLHENDPCCSHGRGRHEEILGYDDDVQAELSLADAPGGSASTRGWMSTAISDWNAHEVCPCDKSIIAAGFSAYSAAYSSGGDRGGLETSLSRLPCDILRGAAVACPEPPPLVPLKVDESTESAPKPKQLPWRFAPPDWAAFVPSFGGSTGLHCL